jgi:DNA-binding IscR family transcriptional regulator
MLGLSDSLVRSTNAVVFLACRSGRPATLEEVAGAIRVPIAAAAEVVADLARAGIIELCPPGAMGARLPKRSDELTLGDIAQAAGVWHADQEAGTCAELADALAAVRQQVFEDFQRMTIRQLVARVA